MSFDLSSLSSDPLLYFLAHSTLFVVIIASIFFTFGLAFGWLTWARYKSQRRDLILECELLKNEIAGLKRRLAEQISRASSLAEASPPAEAQPTRPAHAGSDPVLDSFLTTAAAIMPQRENKPLKSNPAAEPAGHHAPAEEAVWPRMSATTPQLEQRTAALQSLIKHEAGQTLTDQPGADLALQQMPASPNGEITKPEPAGTSLSPAPDSAPDAAVRLMSDPHLGLVYAGRPALADDLSHLKGVAHVIESRLHELGVYTFKQIALWNDENIREFSNLLAFKDRIHREQWVEQARELHYQKYGERL